MKTLFNIKYIHSHKFDFIGVVIYTLLIIFTGQAKAMDAPTTTTDTALLKSSITLSAKYLEKSVDENGKFLYCINMNPEVQVPENYNLLRHAACVYVMCIYYEMQPDKEMLAAIKRAGKFLQNEIGPIPHHDDLLAVWSKPELTHSRNPLNAKLGATGLGLAALVNIEKFQSGFTPRSTLEAMGRFIIFMQKEDGSFYSRYFPDKGGYDKNWTSLYYPGEATLGLLALYETDRSETWLKSATGTLEYLARGRRGKQNVPVDHWALLATDKLLSLKNLDELRISRELLINHANQICGAILKTHALDDRQLKSDVRSVQVTTISTYLEGLQAALNFLPPDDKMRPPVEDAVDRGIAFLLDVQVRDGKYAGAFQQAVGAMKRFRNDQMATEVRIDYVQHALNAMIQNLQLRNKKQYSSRHRGN